jgi:predicted nucleotidyltransferase component of viral defense system
LSARPSLTELVEVQKHFQLPSTALVAKDWRVLRAMQAIAAVDGGPFRLVFAGGTALARAHKRVRRMSEDIDFKIVPIDATPISGNKQRQHLGDLRDRITAGLQAAGFPLDGRDSAQLRSRDSNRYTVYHLTDHDPGRTGDQLRPTNQIELTHATLRQPSVRLPVASFIAEAYGRPPEVPAIDCVNVTETAAEKLVAVTRRRAMELAGVSRNPDPTLVRHLYDLHMIRDHIDRDTAVALVREIARQDAEEFGNQYPAYRADIVGETRKALAAWTQDPAAKSLYDNFVAAMVYGERVAFSAAISTLTGLVDDAWPGATSMH